MPLLNCLVCQAQFYVKPSHKKIGYGKFCTIKCRSKSQRNGKYVKCDYCKKSIYRSQRLLNRSKTKKYFCCKNCQASWKNKLYSNEKHPNWKGGISIYRKKLLSVRRNPECSRCKNSDKRVLVAHHIDANRRNNSINNLVWMCHNCHFLIHNYNDATS